MKRRVRWSRVILAGVLGVLFLINLGIFAGIVCLNDEGYIASHLSPKPIDETPPVIELNGGEVVTIATGTIYEDTGAEAYDARSEATVVTEGEVNTAEPGEYVIKYIATDEKGNTAAAQRTVKVINPRGMVYLTFDDGPGPYTAALLDVLAKYNVKVTFFVTGAGDDSLITREYNEGHAVGLHSLSHRYNYIYVNTANYWDDLLAVQERVRNATGGYESHLMRFPGGSSNTVSARYDGGSHIMSTLVREVTERGFTYFDWNIASGDAAGATTADQVFDTVTSQLKEGGSSVVLQHDIKQFSVEAVERIIQYGLENGFVFDKLDANSFTAHHGVNN